METTNLVADTICRTVELGLTITGAAINETVTHIDCRPVEYDPTCPSCGQPGRLRDHVERPPRGRTPDPSPSSHTQVHLR